MIGSTIATLSDFGAMIFATEILGIYYVYSTAIGATMGAIVGFLLLRNWAFERTDQKIYWQAIRYILASILIMNVNVAGVYLITENFEISYMISRVIISIFAGIFVSFPLFRYFVYQ